MAWSALAGPRTPVRLSVRQRETSVTRENAASPEVGLADPVNMKKHKPKMGRIDGRRSARRGAADPDRWGNQQRGETIMIIGAHSVIGSTDPEADHRFLRDVLGLPAVDGGGGYLIFGLPPAEVSVHPSSKDNLQHELYFLCDNIDAFISEMHKHSVPCGPVQHEGWGLLTRVTLPGGGSLGVYQPQHERPTPISVE
jgi:hypothetical protein